MPTEDNITTMDDESTGGEQPSGPAELRAAYEREKDRRRAAEAKLAASAFRDAGFPEGTTERKALEKYFDGDRTDPLEIRRFATEELGYTVEEPVKIEAAVRHVQPAPTVVADAKADQMDAASTDLVGGGDDETELAKKRDALLKAAIEPGSGIDNATAVELAMAAELARAGVPPFGT